LFHIYYCLYLPFIQAQFSQTLSILFVLIENHIHHSMFFNKIWLRQSLFNTLINHHECAPAPGFNKPSIVKTSASKPPSFIMIGLSG
jgi:hypothetical protein